jgi:hypothetical protein
VQPTLEGLPALEQEVSWFDNCLMLSWPEYKDTGKKQEWVCSVHT